MTQPSDHIQNIDISGWITLCHRGIELVKTIVVYHIRPCNKAAHVLLMTVVNTANNHTKQKCNDHDSHKDRQTDHAVLRIVKIHLCLIPAALASCYILSFLIVSGADCRPALFHNGHPVSQITADRKVHGKHDQKSNDCHCVNHPHSFSPLFSIVISHAFSHADG